MKIFKKAILMLILLTMLISVFGCSEKCYGDYEVGENFWHNIDGHHKKLPKNYCLVVDLGGETILVYVPDEGINDPDFEIYSETPVLKGHYIKGWFDDNTLVLCEETENDVYSYLSFGFDDHNIEQYADETEVMNKFHFDQNEWFTLCNTFSQKLS